MKLKGATNLSQIWRWFNLSQQHPTCLNTAQQGGQTRATYCAQKCCDRLAGPQPEKNYDWQRQRNDSGRHAGLMERAVRVRALAGDTVLCSWARHLTLTVPLSTQVYKWVPVNCWGNLTNCGGMTCDGLASHPGGVEILLAASCCRNRG